MLLKKPGGFRTDENIFYQNSPLKPPASAGSGMKAAFSFPDDGKDSYKFSKNEGLSSILL